MKNFFLFTGLCFSCLTVLCQPWIFNPTQTTTKFYDGSAWNLTNNQSSIADYTYSGTDIDYLITKIWNGSNFVVDNSSVKMDYFYNGNLLDYTTTKFWNGTSYVLTDYSTKTEYYYNGNNQVDYTILKYWDSGTSSWYLGYQWIGFVSTKTEYHYSGSNLDYQIMKYYDGSNWFIGYTTIGILSTKTEYSYLAGKLDYTTSKYYDGSNWYTGYQYVYDQSIKTEYHYQGNSLDYTISKYYDGSNWYIGYQYNYAISVKTEYLLSTLSQAELSQKNTAPELFPNPATDLICLKTDYPDLGSSYLIRDLSGSKIMEGTLDHQLTEIDLSSLIPGIYFIQLAENPQQVLKLIKE